MQEWNYPVLPNCLRVPILFPCMLRSVHPPRNSSTRKRSQNSNLEQCSSTPRAENLWTKSLWPMLCIPESFPSLDLTYSPKSRRKILRCSVCRMPCLHRTLRGQLGMLQLQQFWNFEIRTVGELLKVPE